MAPTSENQPAARRPSGRRDFPPTRDRLISTGARLFRERGVTGTGLLSVLEAARAPRGSLYHHFPGGKNELVIAALQFEADRVTTVLQALVAAVPDPGAAIRQFADALATELERTEFKLGCPVSTAALELAAESDAVREVCADTYDRWQQLLTEQLERSGLPREKAQKQAELTLAAIEGALLLARARRDGDIVRRVASALTT